MAERSRYNVSRKSADLQNGDVLENKLGITDQEKLDDAETLLLADSYEHFIPQAKQGELSFDLDFLFELHSFFSWHTL